MSDTTARALDDHTGSGALGSGALDAGALDPGELDILATALRRAATTSTGEALDRALGEIGWIDAVPLAPRGTVSSLFEAQGAAGSTSGALGLLLRSSLGLPVDAAAAVVLPRFGTWSLPAVESPDSEGDRSEGDRTMGDRSGDLATIHGLGDSSLHRADHVLVIGTVGGTPCWTSVPTTTLSQRDVAGLDPRLGLVEVHGTVDAAGWEPLALPWEHAVARCRLALGHELVGTMRTMLSMACEHALGRVQFDRPIAGFQAVRHRLAESLVAIEGAAAALDGAWEEDSPVAATIAKSACGHGARTVRRHCQQVLAGIGFTTEHDLHHFVRRSMVLDGLLGDARTLTTGLGAAALEHGTFPSPPGL